MSPEAWSDETGSGGDGTGRGVSLSWLQEEPQKMKNKFIQNICIIKNRVLFKQNMIYFFWLFENELIYLQYSL